MTALLVVLAFAVGIGTAGVLLLMGLRVAYRVTLGLPPLSGWQAEVAAALALYFVPVRFALAWTLYGVGHVIWLVTDQWLDLFREEDSNDWAFDAYQWLMTAAHHVQGNGPGPWSPIASGD